MPEGRPAIPEPMRRDVLIESGYRCAMPTCRDTTVDICHIDPWAQVRTHEFANLIALCANDHRRFDAGDIPKIAIRQIKANLSLLGHRYTELERRVLEQFAKNGGEFVGLEASLEVLYRSLIDDGVLAKRGEHQMEMAFASEDGSINVSIPAGPVLFGLTEKGRALVTSIRAGGAIS